MQFIAILMSAPAMALKSGRDVQAIDLDAYLGKLREQRQVLRWERQQ